MLGHPLLGHPLLGHPLDDYPENAFHLVPEEYDLSPADTVDPWAGLAPCASYLRENYLDPEQQDIPLEQAFDLQQYFSGLPEACFLHFSAEEAARIWMSSRTQMDISPWFEEVQRTHSPQGRLEHKGRPDAPWLRLFGKITNSLWHFGYQGRRWNEAVEAYQAIRRFHFGIENFTTTLDFTLGHNDHGRGTFDLTTWLDGPLAFRIHHNGTHVLTLGFAIAGGRRVLVTQVQLKRRKGNRWLYRLPFPYMEHALQQFRSAFPEWTVSLIDGLSLARYHRVLHPREPVPQEVLTHVIRTYRNALAPWETGPAFRCGPQRMVFHPILGTSAHPRKIPALSRAHADELFPQADEREKQTLDLVLDPSAYALYAWLFTPEGQAFKTSDPLGWEAHFRGERSPSPVQFQSLVP